MKAYRGAILHFVDDPFLTDRESDACEYFADGLLLVDQGKIVKAGPYEELKREAEGLVIESFKDALILPGFIDTHAHYAQTGIIASYGEQLLDWLTNAAFPAERAFSDPAHAGRIARAFLGELLRNGTTTALVFCTVHPESVDAFFEASAEAGTRMIAGKVLMDRNAPDYLQDTPERAYAETRALIGRWHGKGRAHYAVTPRFAPTSSERQLEAAGRLRQEFPDTFLHTHISENLNEIAWVKELYKDLPKPSGSTETGYLDVYDHFGLLGPRSILAHGVHLTEAEFQRLAGTGSALAFCPTSNLFLGSGLFPLREAKARRRPVKVGLATDVGGGTSFSMLQTLNEAYKVAQMGRQGFTPLQGFFLATLGGAQALGLEDRIGSFRPGREADFVVLDPRATPLMAMRMETIRSLSEQLFLLMMLGDDRAVRATYVMGKEVHRVQP